MRWISILLILSVTACSSAKYHELPQTSKDDPVWQLNPEKWTFNENALTTAPGVQP